MVSDGRLDELIKSTSDDESVGFHNDTFRTSVRFGQNLIFQKEFREELSFKRYYKSDWQGMYTKRHIFYPGQDKFARDMAQIATLDCRHGDDRIDAILAKYAETLKTLETKE